MAVEIPRRETIRVEFKSDRKGYSDDGLVDEIVGMANSEGGTLFLGVEDDGEVRLVHHGARQALARIAEEAFVVDAGRVDQDAGAEPRQLRDLADGVRRRAGDGADERDFLATDGVDQGRLAAVGEAEEGDAQAVHGAARNGNRGHRARWRRGALR